MEPQESMILKKSDERERRELEHRVGRRGPDGGAHRNQVFIEELPAEAAHPCVIFDRHRRKTWICQDFWTFFVEAIDVAQQQPEFWIEKIFPLGKKPGDAGAAKLESRRFVLHASKDISLG